MTGPRDDSDAVDPHYSHPQYPPPQYPASQYPDPQYPASQYPDPQYPDPQYPPDEYLAHPGYPPSNGPARASGSRLSPQVVAATLRRPAPQLGVALAGVGVLLVIAGVSVWGATYALSGLIDQFDGSGGGGSGSRQYLGAVLAIIVAAIGYVLVIRTRTGPLSTAGVAASALGIPVAMTFLTFSTDSQPFSTDAVVWVSIVFWLASYLFVPGAQGRVFYLGASLLALWEYALDKASPDASGFAGAVVDRVGGGVGGGGDDFSTGGLAATSLVIGIGYYAVAWALDRSGRRGAGVAFALVGFPAVAAGIAALAPDLEQVGTGVVLLVAGVALGAYGARYERRFTTWVWAVGAGVGAVLILTKVVTHGGTAIGIALIVLGVVFVAGGWVAANVLRESHQPAEPVPGAPTGQP